MKKVLILSALFALVLTSCESLQKYQLGDKNVLSISGSEERAIFIKSSSTIEDVITAMHTSDILSDEESFKKLAELKNYEGKNIVPGKYTVKGSMSNNDLINHLRAGNGREEVQVTFNNCLNLQQVAGAVAKQIEADSASLYQLMSSEETQKKYGFNTYTIPTLFIPNTYRFQWATDAQGFLDRMAKEYKNFWNTDRKAQAKKIGLQQSEVAILASIVEEEQNLHPEEWRRIAGVYMNRYNNKWLLQADPTVKYAVGDRTIKRILFKHLEVDSPYNTYKVQGLPPGPLRIPSTKSMDAVLNYEQHEYMYFCAKPGLEGLHNFAKTLGQHNANAAAYHKWLNKNGY